MNSSIFRGKVLEEVMLIPASKLEEAYDIIHYFRIGLKSYEKQSSQIMKFAGCWKDMSEKTFVEFSQEILARRHQAFSRRRSKETEL